MKLTLTNLNINFNINSQSGFRPNDSYLHQLIAIAPSIFGAFDGNPSLEVRGVSLDLSKAFDRVWHDGLFYKLKSDETEGNLFKLIEWFLNNRCQWVGLNGQSPVWKLVTAGVPRDSVLARPITFSHLH